MQQLILIDGSLHEGGGQMIRSSIALSVILRKEFQMHSIRKNRPNPGINNQLRNIFTAFSEKIPKVGDSEIFFYPKFLAPKEIKASTAASCTLMMQCLVPICLGLQYQQQIKINGGSDVNKSPPVESIRLGLIPLLRKMNVKLNITDVKPGYFPVGKGYISYNVDKCQEIKPLKMVEVGVPSLVVITYYNKDNKVPGSSKELRKEITRGLNHAFGGNLKLDFEIKAQKVFCTKDNYGIGCLVLGDNLVWDIGTVGQKVQEEIIIQRLFLYAEKKCCLDEHHQDQLLLCMALANGTSQLLVGEDLSEHTESLIYVIKSFLPQVQISHKEAVLSVTGVCFKFDQA